MSMIHAKPSLIVMMLSLRTVLGIFVLHDRNEIDLFCLISCLMISSFIVNLICPATYSLFSLIVSTTMSIQFVWNGNIPSIFELCMTPLMTVMLIGGPMSVGLHRFFSHKAFETSRIMQFFLGIFACLAFQGDPLWWAIMHNRHHKHCDSEKDPHSFIQRGFYYAFFGWMINPINYQLNDSDYSNLYPCFIVPELRILSRLHMMPCIAVCSICYICIGYSAMIFGLVIPLIACRIITLLFNVEYHGNNKEIQGCQSIDNDRFLAKLVGESKHKDHHVHPRKANRPDWDFPYVFILAPLEIMGMIWNLR